MPAGALADAVRVTVPLTVAPAPGVSTETVGVHVGHDTVREVPQWSTNVTTPQAGAFAVQSAASVSGAQLHVCPSPE